MEKKDIPMERIVAEVPADLKRQVMATLALQGRPLKELIENLLAEWLAKQGQARPPGK